MTQPAPANASDDSWSLVIHGGAGVILRSDLSAAQDAAYRAALTAAADAGAAVLRGGGTALDAVQAAVSVLEDDALFNAGRGAVFTAQGRIELDAAIMDGATLNAGAVAGVTAPRHPIALARAVMERSPHVMLIGPGADAFAAAQGLDLADPAWFHTQRRWRALEATLFARGLPIPPPPPGLGDAPDPAGGLTHDEGKRGTVGAVARDTRGNVAAATSTGGLTAKQWGRVGDSPLIGAGTYADNRACAVSATGAGEYFIRLTVARTIAALVQYEGLTLQQAADRVVREELTALGGDGGVIAVAPSGEMAWSFNTPGMYRARICAALPLRVGLYGDED
jgi:beta-aspartyl-peptidase (threonine type)